MIAATNLDEKLIKAESRAADNFTAPTCSTPMVYTNSVGQPANDLIIVDPNPANAVPADRVFRNVDFKIGPNNTGSVSLTVRIR